MFKARQKLLAAKEDYSAVHLSFKTDTSKTRNEALMMS